MPLADRLQFEVTCRAVAWPDGRRVLLRRAIACPGVPCFIRILALAAVVLAARGAPASDQQVLETIADGWLANRQSFTTFSCRFVWRFGVAANLEAAIRGEFSEVIDHDCMWLVDGEKVRYEIVCNPNIYEPGVRDAKVNLQESIKKSGAAGRSGTGIVAIPCHVEHYLRSATVGARQAKGIGAVNLYPSDQPDKHNVGITPFSMLSSVAESDSPSNVLRSSWNGSFQGRWDPKFDGDSEFRRTPALAFSVWQHGGPVLQQYRVDPNRGFLVLRYALFTLETGRKQFEFFTLDAKDCGQGRWFPVHSLVVVGDADAAGPIRVQDVRVTELALDPPAADQFYLDIPAGTQVNIVNSHDFVTLDEPERVMADQLDVLRERAVAHGEHFRRMSEEIMLESAASGPPGASQSARRFWIILGSTVLALGATALFLLFRRGRHAH